MSISEQVKELRECVEECDNPLYDMKMKRIAKLMYQAADAIETLSAKLDEANMECLERYYVGGWITDRIPTKEECGNYQGHFLVTVHANELKTLCMEYEYADIRGKEVGRWIWCGRVNIPWEVIAWRKFPEPYHP